MRQTRVAIGLKRLFAKSKWQTREVLAEGPSKRVAGRWSGRDSGNRIVVWDVGEASYAPGESVSVKILEAHPQVLVGTC